ncbi:TetR/AcrR family transcriptional regulator [Gordonia sp. NPDC003429]
MLDNDSSTLAGAGRRYAGTDAEQRRTRRRAALVDAGLDLFGSEGYAAVSVKRVCEHAGLTQRYFYESFTDRPALLAAVYEHCVAVTRGATVDAAAPYLGVDHRINPSRLRAAAHHTLDAFLRCLTGDRRMARIILVEVVGVDPALERLRMGAIHDWAGLALALVGGERDVPAQAQLTAVGVIGALTQLLVDWYVRTDADPESREPAAQVDMIRDVCVELFVAAHRQLTTGVG